MEGSHVFKLTNDDWHKNHYGNKVKLMYHGNINCNIGTHKTYRVSVSGGFCWAFDSCIEREVIDMFFMLSQMSVINKKDLVKLGFKVV